ncbi:TPA: DUF6701 domain-containing protein [Vibrio campbellii]
MRKIITLILAKVLLLSSFASFSAVNNNPQFEFGTIPAEDCHVLNNERGVTCDIKFQNTYDEEPLVFVMSTIDASMSNFSQKRTEYPSDLRVWSKSKAQATVKQLFPPHSAACNRLRYNSSKKKWQCTNNNQQGEKVTFVDAPMEDIDYLVIEPGVIKFDGDAMIVAGEVSSNLTYSNIGGSTYRSKEVKFRDFGLNTSFASAPGVLVQLQTRNNYSGNEPLWLSSIALNPTTKGFSLIIDRSEVTRNSVLSRSENVAFVAGLGQGFVNGRKFWLGDGSTRNTLGDLDDNVIKPVTEGCLQVSDFPVSGFKSAPVLLASKRTRNGNNGGWLRRCSVTKNGVALINEEDMQRDSERGHVVEPFSYFLFDKPPVDDVCQLFPSPAQTWDTNTNGELVMSNNTLISGASLSNGKRYVGFKPGQITMHNNASCDNQSCLGDSGLMVKKQTLESFRSPQDPNLQNVIVSGRHGVGERTFRNNEIIGNLSVEETGTVYFESGTYWVGAININNEGKIIIPDGEKVTIHAKSVSISNKNSFFGELEGGELIVLVHDSQSSYVNFGNNTAFSGLLYSEVDVPLSNNVIVNGAITAKNIRMANNAEIHATDNHCFTPSDNYEVTLSPATQYALMCGTEQPSFEIETKNDGYAESTGVTVQVYPDSDKFSVEVTDSTGTGTGTYPSFTTSNVSSKLGKLKLQVTVTDQSGIELNDEYTFKVTVDNDPSKTQTSTFKFVPFKFDVDDQTVVAGKNYQIETRVLACSDGQQTVVKSYTGSPSVQLEIETPADGRSDESLLTYEPKFIGSEHGKTSDTFKLMESGLYTIKLEDANFTCDPQYSDECPIAPDEEKGEQESVTLNGSFSVKSRPWKIAACNIVAKNGGKTNPATQATGDGFIASAESFNVTYKPVVHSESRGNATDICDYPLTQNYFSSDNTNAPLDIKFDVAYPVDGDLANLSEDNGFVGSLTFSKAEAASGKEGEYAWNEAGSLNLTTNASYLEMSLDEDSQVIGRFYPKFFQVIASDWDYPESQSFAYMNQPFDAVEFSVEALNANKSAIKNYADFSTKAEFNLDDIEHYSGRFDAPDFGAGSWSNESDKSIGDFSISNSGQCIGSACWNKDLGGNYPDGPFNSVNGTDKSQIGLIYTNNADPVEFIADEDSNSRLVKQPDIRFGRIDLDDVGGNQGSTLHVPLRVEFWNGSRFVANPHDSQTDVKGVTAAETHIWPTGTDAAPKAVTLGAGGKVSEGYSRTVTAKEAESYRQQTRVWLDLDASANGLPWLKYNWNKDNAGEENPSSVVTFGIHRGNDRVIYRGEPGLTGQ